MSHPLEHSRIGLLACSCASIANMHYQDESSVRRVGRLLHYRLGRLPDIECSRTYSARVARSRVARIKEDPLLQHEEPPRGVDGDGLNRDQDRLHPEKSHLDLRVLSPAAPIQEEPLQPPDLTSSWVTNPVTRALFRRIEPFDGPRASPRRP